MNIDDKILNIFRSVLLDENLALDAYTTAKHIPDWDSLTHINLIFTIEDEYGIRFSTSELDQIANVGDLQQLVNKKCDP